MLIESYGRVILFQMLITLSCYVYTLNIKVLFVLTRIKQLTPYEIKFLTWQNQNSDNI